MRAGAFMCWPTGAVGAQSKSFSTRHAPWRPNPHRADNSRQTSAGWRLPSKRRTRTARNVRTPRDLRARFFVLSAHLVPEGEQGELERRMADQGGTEWGN